MIKALVIALTSLSICGGQAFAQSPTPSAPAQPSVAPEAAPPAPAADPKVYGEYPAMYKRIVGRWLEKKLADPTSAVIDWLDTPKPGEYKTQKGQLYVGYVIDIKVNARNQYGAPTGKQRYRIVIRDDEVIWGGRPRY